MLIRVEPAGFSMYTVQMVFDTENPDSEDQEVRQYLKEHGLEPRYQWTSEFEGRQCEWLLYGGCYLGNHLNGIGQIQRRAVEVELLTAEIERHLGSLPVEEGSLDGEQRQEAVAALVEEFHQDSSFQVNDNGELTAALDGSEVSEAARRWLADP
jgi:hypothetical protein